LTERVVLDTNVFVAAGFNSHSASARIIERVETGGLCLVWDEATRRETRTILRQIPPLSWERRAPLFLEENRFAEAVHPEQFAWVPDPDDRKFAALAAASGAVLVTNDDHLLARREEAGLSILTPDELWHSLESSR
jgi:predicted nucleic acid-binding protein